MHPFSTPWKHQKTLRFSDDFRGLRKGALGADGLIPESARNNMSTAEESLTFIVLMKLSKYKKKDIIKIVTGWTMSVFGVLLGSIFLYLDWIQSKWWENTDTFHVVTRAQILSIQHLFLKHTRQFLRQSKFSFTLDVINPQTSHLQKKQRHSNYWCIEKPIF